MPLTPLQAGSITAYLMHQAAPDPWMFAHGAPQERHVYRPTEIRDASAP